MSKCKLMVRAALGAAFACCSVFAAETRPLRYFNVVPIRGGDVEFTAREVKRQTALGMKAIAVSLSYHPQCTPAAAVRGSAINNTVRNTTVGTLTQKVVKKLE